MTRSLTSVTRLFLFTKLKVMNSFGTDALIRLIRIVPDVKYVILTVSKVFLSLTKEFLHVLGDDLIHFLAYR